MLTLLARWPSESHDIRLSGKMSQMDRQSWGTSGFGGHVTWRPQAGTPRLACRATRPGEPVVCGALRPSHSTSPPLIWKGSDVPSAVSLYSSLWGQGPGCSDLSLSLLNPLCCDHPVRQQGRVRGWPLLALCSMGALSAPPECPSVSPTSCPAWASEPFQSSHGL